MARRGYLAVRMDENLMQEVHSIFNELNISPADALSIIYKQVKLHHGFPFEIKIPNAETIAAMNEPIENMKSFANTQELFESWDMEL